jgi:phytoene dehydrogenase-like protein
MAEKIYDVLVVVAGAAGLTSAVYLSRQSRSVLLAEASDRPGGPRHLLSCQRIPV